LFLENHPDVDEQELIDDFVLFFFAGKVNCQGFNETTMNFIILRGSLITPY